MRFPGGTTHRRGIKKGGRGPSKRGLSESRDAPCSRQDRYTVDEIKEWLAWWQEKACGFVSVRTDIADPRNGISAWRKRKGENAD